MYENNGGKFHLKHELNAGQFGQNKPDLTKD